MVSNYLEQSIKIKNTLFQKIKNFFKTEFYFFIKNYIYFIIFFSIIFYIIIEIINNTKNKLIITETKIFFYISIIFLFIMISDILEKPYDSVNKFIYIMLFSVIILYICNYLIIKYYKQPSFIKKILLIIGISIIITILFILFISFIGFKNKIDIYNSFNYSINKNYYFLVFFMIYMILYKFTFDSLNLNSTLTDILTPAILGLLLISFAFILIVNLCFKLKIIKKINILNSFFSFFALLFFFIILLVYIFMNSLSTICHTNSPSENSSNEEIIIILIFISIFIILWLNDSRNWHRNGSIAFVFSSIIAFYTMFYYSIYHPNISMLSLWLFIEWLIIFFKKKENSKNSIHFSFMTT